MKSIDFSKFSGFVNIRKKMGIPDNYVSNFKLNFSNDFKINTWKEKISGTGLVISPTDDNFTHDNPDGLLKYGDEIVLLYIRDQVRYIQKNEVKNIKSSYKYHLTWCKTMEDMDAKRKFDKYVVSNNTSGWFDVKFVYNNNEISDIEHIQLNVCKNCLRKLGWKGYGNGIYNTEIYENFSLTEYFEYVKNNNKYDFRKIPMYNSSNARDNVYPPDWEDISAQLKNEVDYRCQKCHWQSKDKKGLNVHHINGLKYDCNRSNLIVLCIDCHQKEHSHKINRFRKS